MPSVGMKAHTAAIMIIINTSSTAAKLTCSAYNISITLPMYKTRNPSMQTTSSKLRKFSLSISVANFPGQLGLAEFIGAKDDGSGGENWSYKVCSHIVTINKPTPNFLQARCPSCCPNNSVKALREKLRKSLKVIYFLSLFQQHLPSSFTVEYP